MALSGTSQKLSVQKYVDYIVPNRPTISYVLAYNNEDFLHILFDHDVVHFTRGISLWMNIQSGRLCDVDQVFDQKNTHIMSSIIITNNQYQWNHNPELAKKAREIVDSYINAFIYTNAVVIQTYFRRWLAKKRFSKQRMCLLTEIVCLPPKFVSPSFPGGSQYIEAFNHFSAMV